MSQVIEVDDSTLLEKYSSNQPRKQRLRRNVQLLFLGLSAEETAPLITLLRTSRISPRGKQINNEQEFLSALSERSWDLILCTIDRGEFTSKQAISHLKRLDKDIPVIQIIPSSDSHLLLQGLKNHIQAVVPLDEKELVLINIRRELDHLDNRRRLRVAEVALAEAEKRAEQLMLSSKNAIACCDQGTLICINESFLDLFGFESNEQVEGKPLIDLLNFEDRKKFTEQLNKMDAQHLNESELQLNVQRSDRTEFTANVELSVIERNEKPLIRVLFRVDDHHVGGLLNEDLDYISGLFNKHHLHKQLEQITQRAQRGGNDCSLLYIELDQLEQIKEKRGHEGSDQLIRDVSALLHKKVNKAHLLTHPEENAFVIVFKDPHVEKAEAFAKKLCQCIANTCSTVAGVEVQSTCSIGITIINDSTPPQDELLNRARAAISDLRKETGNGNGVKLHIPQAAITEEKDDELDAIRCAVENLNFKLLYQPIVNLTSDDHNEQYYEVLLRLLNEDQSLVAPCDFMNTVEDSETAIKVDRWVIEHSLIQLKRSLNSKVKNTLFLNISAQALSDAKLLTWLSGVLRKNKIPADRLVFQISESDIAISPRQAQAFTEKLHKIHCRVCIKHFGNALNANDILSMVRSNFVKLDASYIQDLNNTPELDEQFYSLIQQLSSLEKVSIAPQVEDTKTMASLWKAGVDYVQGNYLQPPKEKMDYDFFAEQ
ncbi:EAL domain-containing protein [Neptuniibacter pectenicola]|jgi:diguanylate cyclase (GGDEF)-like protein/PAS domain S-box-containing protein|uniref:EAL domain-containing protein n=1 Tax=Neptuniibacter pectenicola TaxID=1806669 RepID=UPI0008305CF4|nr:GGDEF domain-containing protein [Neptuniibacter pectenicola]|tara:strand:+ start:9604 stop:11745 length:2142 start_codon:yes stop_codon:yes gene_type:complete